MRSVYIVCRDYYMLLDLNQYLIDIECYVGVAVIIVVHIVGNDLGIHKGPTNIVCTCHLYPKPKP